MLKGAHLTLMIGPTVPVPVPRSVIDALTSIEVSASAQQVGGFQLQFTLSNRSPLQTLFMMTGATTNLRVVIMVTVSGLPQVLMDGVMTNHQVVPSNEPGSSTLTITGEDIRKMMDYQELHGIPFPGMTPDNRVRAILAKYARFGIIPIVIPPMFPDAPIPTDRVPKQKGTDLGYIQHMAKENGFVFYITPGPAPLTNLAYWGPEIKIGLPQRALNVNLDADTNAESISFSFDSENKTQPVVLVQEPITKASIPIPVPNISLLNPPLGLVEPVAKKFEVIADTAKMSVPQALQKALGVASRSANGVSVSGNVDVFRYGQVLHPRRLVGVRGAGTAFDGMYYVERVKYAIKRGSFKQDFTLSRNGIVSTLPVVPA